MNQTKNFALIGASGYIAPRHMKAILNTNNRLVVALDKFDSVGVIDSYFPEADFFTEFERFDRHIEKLKKEKPEDKIDFVSICSPNYLHDSHIRFALRNSAQAICEKPLVLNPWNIEALQKTEQDLNGRVWSILQLRHHPSIIQFRNQILEQSDKHHELDLTYITSRGKWYQYSWKGDESKSGGIATNIGIHFFDMLCWVFGDVKSFKLHYSDQYKAAGFFEFNKAKVRWFLSIDHHDLPVKAKEMGQRTYRSFKCDNHEVEFSDGFSDLHTRSYQAILDGEGFGLSDSLSSIDIAYKVRNSVAIGLKGDYHPHLRNVFLK